jgi:hypothetical protein
MYSKATKYTKIRIQRERGEARVSPPPNLGGPEVQTTTDRLKSLEVKASTTILHIYPKY